MLALAAYLVASLACVSKGRLRLLWASLTVFISYTILFICTGRMGYIAYALVMLIWFFEYFNRRYALILSAAFIFGLALSYTVNPMMKFLVKQVKDDWASYHQSAPASKNTSLGLRLQYHKYAQQLFSEKPWLGYGTGEFSAHFAKDKPIKDWEQEVIWEPHSQYWLLAAEFGTFGISLFVGFVLSLIWEVRKQSRHIKYAMLALLAPFVMGCCTDSLLLYSSTGYFFLLFAALILGAGIKSSSTLYSQAGEAGELMHALLPAMAGKTQT